MKSKRRWLCCIVVAWGGDTERVRGRGVVLRSKCIFYCTKKPSVCCRLRSLVVQRSAVRRKKNISIQSCTKVFVQLSVFSPCTFKYTTVGTASETRSQHAFLAAGISITALRACTTLLLVLPPLTPRVPAVANKRRTCSGKADARDTQLELSVT